MNIPKYRAWNKLLRKMAQVIAIELHPEVGGVEVAGQTYVDFETGEHDASRDFWPADDIELMQCIGKTDTTGKDIYEGDIVRDEDGSKGIVERYETGFAVHLHAPDGVVGIWPHWMTDWSHWTVIGHIYFMPGEMKDEAAS